MEEAQRERERDDMRADADRFTTEVGRGKLVMTTRPKKLWKVQETTVCRSKCFFDAARKSDPSLGESWLRQNIPLEILRSSMLV